MFESMQFICIEPCSLQSEFSYTTIWSNLRRYGLETWMQVTYDIIMIMLICSL